MDINWGSVANSIGESDGGGNYSPSIGSILGDLVSSNTDPGPDMIASAMNATSQDVMHSIQKAIVTGSEDTEEALQTAGYAVAQGMGDAYGWATSNCHWKGLLWGAETLDAIEGLAEVGPLAILPSCKVMADGAKAYNYLKNGCKMPSCADEYMQSMDCHEFMSNPSEGLENIRDAGFVCEHPETGCKYTIPPHTDVREANEAGLKKCGAVQTKTLLAQQPCGGVSGYEASTSTHTAFGPLQTSSDMCQMTCYNNNARTANGACKCSQNSDCPPGYPNCVAGVCHRVGVTCPVQGICPDKWWLAKSENGTSTCIAANHTPHGNCSIRSTFKNNISASERQSWVDSCNDGVKSDNKVSWSNVIPLCVGQRSVPPAKQTKYCSPYYPCQTTSEVMSSPPTKAPVCGVGEFYADGRCQTTDYGGLE